MSAKSQVDDVSQSSGNVSVNESGEGEGADNGVTSGTKGISLLIFLFFS